MKTEIYGDEEFIIALAVHEILQRTACNDGVSDTNPETKIIEHSFIE